MRYVSKQQYVFLRAELAYSRDQGILSQDQVERTLALYAIKPGLSFVRVMLVIGAVLVGLGILSFIAANWDELTKLVKYLIIVGMFISFMVVSYKMSEKYPKTSRSFLYLALITYGAGIFLIGQMFNFGGHFTQAFILWAIGVFPAAVLCKDKLVFLFAQLLLLIYIIGSLETTGFAYGILLIPAGYYFARSNPSDYLTFFNNLLVIAAVIYLGEFFRVEPVLTTLLLFVIGNAAFYKLQQIYKVQGTLLFCITGFILTFPGIWHIGKLSPLSTEISIAFSIGYILYLLWLVKREYFIPLVFVCATIFRYYVDLTYNFMPKSFVFISGGVLLLLLGYYIERSRRKVVRS
ncbi:DUF2157 domain-containing protein [Desulforamulus ferrireducens]|uniref:DUF2157 domain-containing protein n=1 Tax=Desulforamulus ferrireducens TaxID=1833852 RepID=UPI001A9A6A93|nr:DUF2157 domain-containing protein [Desulforamulus ferrireducens]